MIEIKTDGTIYINGKKKKTYIDKNGYERTWWKGRIEYVHRIVAMEHIPNPNNLPQVNHLNLNKTDNNVNNLEWCTLKQNVNHGWKNGAFDNLVNKIRKLSWEQAEEIRKRYKANTREGSYRRLANDYNVNIKTIFQIVNFELYKQKRYSNV